MFQSTFVPSITKTDAGQLPVKINPGGQVTTSAPPPKYLDKLLKILAAVVSVIALIILVISVINIVIVLFNACGGPAAFSFNSCPPFTVSQILAFVSPGIWASILSIVIGVVSAKLSAFSPTFKTVFFVFGFVNTLVASPALVAVSISQVSSLATTFSNATALENGIVAHPPFGALEFSIPIVLAVLGLIMFIINMITLFYTFAHLMPMKCLSQNNNKVNNDLTKDQKKNEAIINSKPADAAKPADASQTPLPAPTPQTPSVIYPASATVFLSPPRRFYPYAPFYQQNPVLIPTPRYAPTFPYPYFQPQPVVLPEYYVPPPYAPTLPTIPVATTLAGNPYYQVW